jgi:pimeloyl-ACP methyl ester carboxylesterase
MFLVAGWSGGGPGAHACAALLPDRVAACMTLASPAPRMEASPAWSDWMSPEDATEFETIATGRGAEVEPSYHEAAAMFQHMTLRRLVGGGEGTPADREAMLGSSGIGRSLVRTMRRAVSTGIWGWFDDAVAQANDWGFRVADIRVPVVVRHGELDRLVDVRHGRWLARRIPSANAEFLPNAGHSAVVDPFSEVVDRLLRARDGAERA